MAKSTGNRWGEGSQAYERWRGNPWGKAEEGRSTSVDTPSRQQEPWPEELNTAKDVEYMSALEKEIVFEYNKVRFDCRRYAIEVLEPMLEMFQGTLLVIPGVGRFRTVEGKAALEEAIRYVRDYQSQFRSLPKMVPLQGLYLGAKDHAIDQLKTGKMGHGGGDRSKPADRALRYTVPIPGKNWFVRENLSYGIIPSFVKWTVAILLIDDDYPDRAHRMAILDYDMTQIGSVFGNHPSGKISVQLLSMGLANKP